MADNSNGPDLVALWTKKYNGLKEAVAFEVETLIARLGDALAQNDIFREEVARLRDEIKGLKEQASKPEQEG